MRYGYLFIVIGFLTTPAFGQVILDDAEALAKIPGLTDTRYCWGFGIPYRFGEPSDTLLFDECTGTAWKLEEEGDYRQGFRWKRVPGGPTASSTEQRSASVKNCRGFQMFLVGNGPTVRGLLDTCSGDSWRLDLSDQVWKKIERD